MAKKHERVGQFYEFFAGGGMARAGLGPAWECLFANDIDSKKAAAYCHNWGDQELQLADVATLSSNELPGLADLAWASFPCQDLSLAGMGAGLKGSRSGTFWPFWKLIRDLKREDRNPDIIVLENVCGALTSHGGKDFHALIGALAEEGYRYGALIIDAVHFVPQSRPRLFIIAVEEGIELPARLTRKEADPVWTSAALHKAFHGLKQAHQEPWIWWTMPKPVARGTVFAELIEEDPTGVRWHTKAETKRLLDLMSPVHRRKLQAAKETGARLVGAVYKRTRPNADGERQQRAEIRFDDIAGCLRTPSGGSSRQLIVVVEGDNVRSRLLSPREAGRLMGLPEAYELPQNYNEAYHLAGDGLVVPAVRHLAANILEPILKSVRPNRRRAA